MFSRAAVRATTQVAGRRGFHATRSQMSSPYHYAEGPYTNIPFNPKAKTFPLLFWGFCATGFSAPFLIAGALCLLMLSLKDLRVDLLTFPQPGKPTSPVHRRRADLVLRWWHVHNNDGVDLGLARRGHGAPIESTIDNFSNRISLSPTPGHPSMFRRSKGLDLTLCDWNRGLAASLDALAQSGSVADGL